MCWIRFHNMENLRGPKDQGVPEVTEPHCGGAVGCDTPLLPLGSGFQGAGTPIYL